MNVNLLKYLDKSDCLVENVFDKNYKVNTDFRNVVEFKKKLSDPAMADVSNNESYEKLLGIAFGKQPAKEIMAHSNDMTFGFRNTLIYSILSVMTEMSMEVLRSQLDKSFR